MRYASTPLHMLLAHTIGGTWGKAPGAGDLDVRVVRVTELKAGGRLDTSTAALRSVTNRELESRRLQPGDLLLEKSGGGPKTPVGRVGLVQLIDGPMCCANFMQLMRPDPRLVDPRFLHLYLNHFHACGGTATMQTASTNIRNIKASEYVQVHIPTPLLREQRRIVEILEEHLSHLDAAAADLTRANVRLESLSEAALQVLIPGDAVRRPLSEVLEVPLSNGRSVPSLDGGFPVLRLTALKEDGVDLEERKGGAWERAEAVRFLVKEGDFLIARGNGSLRLVGKGSLLRHEPDEVAFPDTAIRARARPSAVLPEFLSLVWNSRSTRDQIERVARTSAGIYKVNQSQLGAIQLPVPELSEQMSIVAAMSRLQEHRHVALETIDIATRRSHSLRRAVLAAAFEGKLTGRHTDVEVVEELAGA